MSSQQEQETMRQNLIKVQEYTPISYLFANISNWTIKARITKKYPVKTFQSQRGEGKVFSIDLIDKNKSEIQASFFNEAYQQFHEMLQVGKIYTFSNGMIKKNRGEYGNSNGISLTFNQSSQVVQVLEDDKQIPLNSFNFLKIQDIQEKKDETIIDVVGVIVKADPEQQIQRKNGGSIRKKTIFIADQSEYQIEVNIWGQECDNYDFQIGQIFTLKHGKLSSFKGTQNISILFSSQIFLQNLDIQQCKDLDIWYKTGENSKIEFQVAKFAQYQRFPNRNLLDIEQLCVKNMEKKEEYKLWSDVRCTVQSVQFEGNIYYMSCPGEGCSRKAVFDEGSQDYKCLYCSTSFTKPDTKYITSIRISDESGSLWVKVYDTIASQIFAINAEGARLLKEENTEESLAKLKGLLNESVHKTYKFKILSKIEIYEGKPMIRHQIQKILEDDSVKEGQDIIQQILEFEEEEKQENVMKNEDQVQQQLQSQPLEQKA